MSTQTPSRHPFLSPCTVISSASSTLNDQGLITIGFREGEVVVLFLQFPEKACKEGTISEAQSKGRRYQ